MGVTLDPKTSRPVLPSDIDPIMAERYKLAADCFPRYRLLVEEYVKTGSKKLAAVFAGYRGAQFRSVWCKIKKKPEVMAYLEFLESRKLAEPNGSWCLDRLMAIVNDPKAQAAAKVQAIKLIGQIKDVHGLGAKEDDSRDGGNQTVVKVLVGVDMNKV